MKKRGPTLLSVLLGLALVVGLVGYAVFGPQIGALTSITPLADGLYYLEYRGDYGFSTFLAEGGATSDEEVAAFVTRFLTRGFRKFEAPENILAGCSTLAAQNQDSGRLFGRNFDLQECTALIVKTVPGEGYASISTSNSYFLGLGNDFTPRSLADKMGMLAAAYVPLDGMNEKGLCVAVNALDYPQQTRQNTGKPGLTTTTAIRLLLDGAADVNEAVELLAQYDLHSSADMEYHFALADAAGKAVVVEYIDNVMFVTETAVVTNHFLTPGPLFEVCSSPWDRRYEVLHDHLAESGGIMDSARFKRALADAVQSDRNLSTQWSIVYDQKALRLKYYHRRDFANAFVFELGKDGAR